MLFYAAMGSPWNGTMPTKPNGGEKGPAPDSNDLLSPPVNPSTRLQVITLNPNQFLTVANIDASCNRTHYGSNWVVCVGKSILTFYNRLLTMSNTRVTP